MKAPHIPSPYGCSFLQVLVFDWAFGCWMLHADVNLPQDETAQTLSVERLVFNSGIYAYLGT